MLVFHFATFVCLVVLRARRLMQGKDIAVDRNGMPNLEPKVFVAGGFLSGLA